MSLQQAYPVPEVPTATDVGAQPVDADLTALAASPATAGLVERTGGAAYTTRLLGVGASTSVPTLGDVDTRIAAALVGLVDLKGSTDCSTNPNFPTALKGDLYVVSIAGKIGGASGISVDVGDRYLALADNAGGTQAQVGASWEVGEHNLVGAMLTANYPDLVAIEALGFTAGNSGKVVTVHTDGTPILSTPTAGGVPRALAPLDITTIVAASSSQWEADPVLPGFIRLAPGRTFGADQASAPTLATWTVANTATRDSSSVSGGALILTGVSTSTYVTYNGTDTAFGYRRNITPTDDFYMVGRVAYSLASATDDSGAMLALTYPVATVVLVMLVGGISGKLPKVRVIHSGTTIITSATITSNQAAAGVWLRAHIINRTHAVCEYNLTDTDVEPTTGWVFLANVDFTAAASQDGWFQLMDVYRSVGSDAKPTGTFKAVRIGRKSPIDPDIDVGCLGYTAATTGVIIADIDYGTGKGLPDVANIALQLVARVNKRPGDTAAITFTFTGSDTSAAACTDTGTTRRAAASLALTAPDGDTAVSTAKRYWRLRIYGVSTASIQPGSIKLDGLLITTAAA